MKKLVLLLLAVGLGSQFVSAATIDRTDFGTTAQSSTYNERESSPSLYDGYPETKWLSNWGDPNPWTTYKFRDGVAYAINSYAITSANDAPDRDPIAWVLYGSNDDGANWTEIDHVESVNWDARYQRKVFKCTNTTPYNMYMLDITANDGSGFTQFSEFELIDNGISRTAYSYVTWSSQIGWNEGALRAFDNAQTEDNHTKWLTTGSSTGWLQYAFLGGRAYAINGYTITSPNDFPSRDPKDWKFQGSFNGEDWETLHEVAEETWQDAEGDNRYTPHTFEFTNNVAYPYYKLDITANNGGGITGFAELELLETDVEGAATNVSPVADVTSVKVDDSEEPLVLEWTAGDNSGIQGHYVRIGTSPDSLVTVNGAILPIGTTSYDPATAGNNTIVDGTSGKLFTDTTYYWQIEEALLNDDNEIRTSGDPNNIFSRVWRFTTETSVVTFNPDFPEDAFIKDGETVTFTVEAKDPKDGVILYQWYLDSDGDPTTNGEDELVNGAVYEGVNTATLTVKSPVAGTYRCGCTNEAGKTTYSEYGTLYIKEKLAHWTLNSTDFDGTVYTDISGNGNDATVILNTEEDEPAFADGVVDDALYIADPNGTAKVVYEVEEEELGFNPSEETGRFSISTWIKREETSENVDINMIASKRDGWAGFDQSYWQFMLVESSNTVRFQSYSTSTINTDPDVVTDGEWAHIALTYDGFIARIYVDGVLEAVGGFAVTDKPTATFYIGRNDNPAERFEGAIDDMQVFNYDLSQEEVVELFYDVTNERVCIYDKPAGDINQDCEVNLADFADFAATWLQDGFYPFNN